MLKKDFSRSFNFFHFSVTSFKIILFEKKSIFSLHLFKRYMGRHSAYSVCGFAREDIVETIFSIGEKNKKELEEKIADYLKNNGIIQLLHRMIQNTKHTAEEQEEAMKNAVSIAGCEDTAFLQLQSNKNELSEIFREAIRKDQTYVVKFFIDKYGIEAIQDVVDNSQFDALQLNKCEFLEFLISNGANVKARNHDGMTLFHYAIYVPNLEGFTILLKHGFNVNETLDDGSSLLHLSVQLCSREITEFLLKKGLSIKQRNNSGKTPFAVAVEIRDEVSMEMMISMNADVNEKVKDGKTALHHAASHGDLHMTKLLFDNGAFTDVKDDFGKTPSDYATDTVSGFLKKHTRLSPST